MAGSKGLGRGLDVLLKGLSGVQDNLEVTMVKLTEVSPNPRQPRTEFSEESLGELAASIKEQGVLQPIMVRPATSGTSHGYELVAGERRLRASKIAGLEMIPAIVREVDDEQSLALALIENLQRENLNAMEEAKGLDQLMHVFGLSQESLARKMSRSRSGVANSVRLLQLPEHMQESLKNDAISAGHARALLAIAEPDVRQALWVRMVENGMSVREAERCVAHWREHGSLPEGAAPAPAKRQKNSQVVQDEALKQLQTKLQDILVGMSIRLGGSQEKGKLTISFNNSEQFQELLHRLGAYDDAY